MQRLDVPTALAEEPVSCEVSRALCRWSGGGVPSVLPVAPSLRKGWLLPTYPWPLDPGCWVAPSTGGQRTVASSCQLKEPCLEACAEPWLSTVCLPSPAGLSEHLFALCVAPRARVATWGLAAHHTPPCRLHMAARLAPGNLRWASGSEKLCASTVPMHTGPAGAQAALMPVCPAREDGQLLRASLQRLCLESAGTSPSPSDRTLVKLQRLVCADL